MPVRTFHYRWRDGPKGRNQFARVVDEALNARDAVERPRGTPERSCRCYGGSNGLLTQDATDALFFRRLGASRLLRTLCAAPTGAAAMALYGKMPSVVYQDYPHAKLIVIWGMNPGVSGIHAVPYLREAQKSGARIVVIDPRATAQARTADLHLALRPGTDVVVALAVHRHLFESGRADQAFLAEHTTGADTLRAKAAQWTFDRAAEVAGVSAADLETFAEWYATSSPALMRCGWGLERNRNGGSAVMAVLALPAVGGKFGVRGGGYVMSNSAAWGFNRPWLDTPEPPTRAINMNLLGSMLTDPVGTPVNLLFVYNCNPVATVPDQGNVLRGLRARTSSPSSSTRPTPTRYRRSSRRAAGDDVPRAIRFHARLRRCLAAAHAAVIDPSARRDRTRTSSRISAAAWASSTKTSRALSSRRSSACSTTFPKTSELAEGHGASHAALGRRADPVRRRVPANAGPQGAPVSRGARSRSAARAVCVPNRIPKRGVPARADLALVRSHGEARRSASCPA